MKKEKSLLIITPYFAPQVHAAVYRVHKLAKYLPKEGWKIHVLTVNNNYLYNENPNSLNELSKDSVFIHKASYVEPTLRGLRMFLGGKDRSFKKAKLDHSKNPRGEPLGGSPSPLRSVYQSLLREVNSPDAYWTWKGPAIRQATQIIKQHNIPIVLTTSLPFTTLEIGTALKRTLGVKWVADFRDPMCYDYRLHSSDPDIYRHQMAIERMAVTEADTVTTLTSAHPLILSDFYGPELGAKARFIPTGIDTQFLPQRTSSKSNYIIFVGEFLKGYGDEFFRIFDAVLKTEPAKSLGLRMKIVGQEEVNRARVEPFIKNLTVRHSIDFHDYLPQSEVYKMIEEARAGVICTSRTYPWWTQFAKMVDFIGLRKPVLAIVPDPSEGRKWLQRTNLGVFLDGSIEQSAAKMSAFLSTEGSSIQKANESECLRFHVENQIQEFHQVFLEQLK